MLLDFDRLGALRFVLVVGIIGNSNPFDGKLSRSRDGVLLPDGTALRGCAVDRVRASQEDVSAMVRPDHLRLP